MSHASNPTIQLKEIPATPGAVRMAVSTLVGSAVTKQVATLDLLWDVPCLDLNAPGRRTLVHDAEALTRLYFASQDIVMVPKFEGEAGTASITACFPAPLAVTPTMMGIPTKPEDEEE